MGLVVLDTDVLASASPGESERAQKGWRLLQCLINECYFLLVSPGLWREYRRVSIYSAARRKLAHYAFAKIKMVAGPADSEAWGRLEQLGVDGKDVEWILLAVERGAVFVTWEKYAPRRHKSARREQEHQRVVRAVEDEFGIHIWHPDYALRRLCSESS